MDIGRFELTTFRVQNQNLDMNVWSESLLADTRHIFYSHFQFTIKYFYFFAHFFFRTYHNVFMKTRRLFNFASVMFGLERNFSYFFLNWKIPISWKTWWKNQYQRMTLHSVKRKTAVQCNICNQFNFICSDKIFLLQYNEIMSSDNVHFNIWITL
jgi:hypothetical protein